MPAVDSWLEITIRSPFYLVLILLLLLCGLLFGVIFVFRRYRNRVNELKSEEEELLNQLADYEEELSNKNSSTGEAYLQFIYNISHEVSNPLQSIQTNLENMAKCSPDEVGRWQQSMLIIEAEIRRLAVLTKNLRLLSRLETSESRIKRESVNMKAVIENVIMAQTDIAEKADVHLRYEGPERPARVFGNRSHLHQVMMNLVDNGIKYSRKEDGEVIINLQEAQDHLCVRVIDNGIGIPETDLPYIFDTAYQVPTTHSLRQVGSGLGLAIVKRIVEQHGGEISVHSTQGQGTSFIFDLPFYTPS
jgi:signal transduction histidine kinase